MKYQYSFDAKLFEILPSLADATPIEIQDDIVDKFRQTGHELTEMLQGYDDESEVVSHSAFTLGNQIVVTIMFKRPIP